MALREAAAASPSRYPPQTCRWNFTPAPGWTKEEAQILKLCLMKQGIGRWMQILETGLLPGKLIQQLNGQTQRLLGQQSLAAYTGLQVDIDAIRADNDKLVDAERKNGLVINSGREFGGLRSRRRRQGTCSLSCNPTFFPAPFCSQPDQAAEDADAGGGQSQVSSPLLVLLVLVPPAAIAHALTGVASRLP